MPRLRILVTKTRQGLLIPRPQGIATPNLLYVLPKIDPGQLDENIKMQLERQGVHGESEQQKALDEADRRYEERVKKKEARQEVRRLMEIKNNGGKLMSVGFRKWRQAFYRPPPSKG